MLKLLQLMNTVKTDDNVKLVNNIQLLNLNNIYVQTVQLYSSDCESSKQFQSYSSK